MSTEIHPARSGGDAAAAVKLQILATEHWSLLATRALTYNEALSRVSIFLSILSGAAIGSVSVAAVGGAMGALAALAIWIPPLAFGLGAPAPFVLTLFVRGGGNRRSIKNSPPSLQPRFPSPIKSR